MELKDNILTTCKSRDMHKTSSLRPTFTPSSTGARSKRSTLGDTFTPSRTVAYASTLHGSSHGLGETSQSLSRPLHPPPGIPYALMPASYEQRIFPTSTYSTVGPTMGYNFDHMTGQPLQWLVSSTYPFFPSHLGHHSLPLLARMLQACQPCHI